MNSPWDYPHTHAPRPRERDPRDPGFQWARHVFEPHTVYELWRGGECVYVGMTCDLASRLASHRKVALIQWDEVRTTAVSDRTSAEGLERRLIFLLRPPHNNRWNPDQEPNLARYYRPLRVLADAASP